MDQDTNEELKRLYQELYKLDQLYEKNKLKRTIIGMLLFIAANVFTLYIVMTPKTAGDFFCCLLISAIWGSIAYWICFSLFMPHFKKCQEEVSHINYIKKCIAECEKKK